MRHVKGDQLFAGVASLVIAMIGITALLIDAPESRSIDLLAAFLCGAVAIGSIVLMLNAMLPATDNDEDEHNLKDHY